MGRMEGVVPGTAAATARWSIACCTAGRPCCSSWTILITQETKNKMSRSLYLGGGGERVKFLGLRIILPSRSHGNERPPRKQKIDVRVFFLSEREEA